MTSSADKTRLEDIIARARLPGTKEALRACLHKPTRDVWLLAEKLAWADVPLSTHDCLWLRSKALEQPGRHAHGEKQLDD